MRRPSLVLLAVSLASLVGSSCAPASDPADGRAPDDASAPDDVVVQESGEDAPPPDAPVAHDETDAPDAADAEGGGVSNDAPAPLARIEEVYADRFLDGDKSEYVEIGAAAGTPLDALRLRLVDANGAVSYDVAVGDAGATMPSSGLWVVGASCWTTSGFCPAHVDQTYSITTWGLSGDLGAVQLVKVDGAGAYELLDVVAWGGAPPAPATPPTKVVDGSPAPKSDARGHAIGRRPGVATSHDDAIDFCLMSSSAGAPNGACL
jgi:hypothetical protein